MPPLGTSKEGESPGGSGSRHRQAPTPRAWTAGPTWDRICHKKETRGEVAPRWGGGQAACREPCLLCMERPGQCWAQLAPVCTTWPQAPQPAAGQRPPSSPGLGHCSLPPIRQRRQPVPAQLIPGTGPVSQVPAHSCLLWVNLGRSGRLSSPVSVRYGVRAGVGPAPLWSVPAAALAERRKHSQGMNPPGTQHPGSQRPHKALPLKTAAL